MKRNSAFGKVITTAVFLVFLAAIPISTLVSSRFTNWVLAYFNLNEGNYGGSLWGFISTIVGLFVLTSMVSICVFIESKVFKDDF